MKAEHHICPICSARAHIVYRCYPGYVEPSRFDIVRCFACDTNYALFNGGDLSALYDRIYARPSLVPGYNRYSRYAAQVSEVADPLGFLADNELSFWALREALKTAPNGVRALDVGSGLGYLTYALNRAGYAATGLDISSEAVGASAAKFGEFYTADNLYEHARQNPQSYDLVILSSIIAHVPDIAPFFEACLSLTKIGGKVIVLTPNKDGYASHLIWASWPPPALLYWLSSSSLEALGHRSGAEIEFTDLSHHPSAGQWRGEIPTRFVTSAPILDPEGNPLSRRRSLLARLANSLRKRIEKDDLAHAAPADWRPAPTLCAVFRRG